ncbi:extra-large guanine nucleotide-binding protein 1 [Rosa sericea]
MTSGGIRTSVKAYINEQRLASLAVNHENNEGINTHLDPLAEAMTAASSNSYGLCDGNMPCLPILSSATKEGQKPSEVISSMLCVGGRIKMNASNGNTEVFINGREITKVELLMLQLVGVQCAADTHFWVYDDGSYELEGENNIKGSIWGTAATKLVCAVLSLPVPSKSSNPVIPDIIEQRTQNILLVGDHESVASTIFKQARILYRAIPFSVDERESIKSTIQRNIYGYLGILLEVRERFEEECLAEMRRHCSSSRAVSSGMRNNAKTPYSIGPKLKAFSDWLLKTKASGYLEAIFPAATFEFAPFVEELWNDSAIQRAVHILRVNYEPTDRDILYAEGDTSANGLACVDFSFPQSEFGYENNTTDQHDSLLRYQLIRVSEGLGESCQWLETFGDAGLVIFCLSLSDYDQFSADGNSSITNKMLQSRAVFESIVTHPSFEKMNCLLLLSKFDLFVKKIARVPLTQCDWFDDFNPLLSYDLGQPAYEYVAVKFKRLYSSLTNKKLYVSPVEDFEPDSVIGALKYSTEILKWDNLMGNCYLSIQDYSICSSMTSGPAPSISFR